MRVLWRVSIVLLLFVANASPCIANDFLSTGPFLSDSSLQSPPKQDQPQSGNEYRDIRFGTTVRRLSQTAVGYPGTVPEYPKAQAWNADGSLLLLRGTDGSSYIYNGKTLTGRKKTALPTGDIEPRWSPTNPDTLTYLLGDSVFNYNIKSERSKRLVRLRGFGPLSSGAEQERSINGRYFALHGKIREDGEGRFISTRASVVDLKTKRHGPAKTLTPPDGNKDDFLDYVAITPDGKNVMVMWAHHGADLYTRSWRYVRRLTDWDEHGDFCRDSNGKYWFVQAHYRAEPNDEVIEATPLDGGPRKTLWQASAFNMALHVSCRNTGLPNWAFISTYWDGLGQRPGPTAFENEIFALGLDSTVERPVVRRLAHTQMLERADYYDEPHATVSRDGRVVLFASNFGKHVSDQSYDDTYAVLMQ